MKTIANTDILSHDGCNYYDSKPSECTRPTCEVRSKLSANTKYCPIYFCKLTSNNTSTNTFTTTQNPAKTTHQKDISQSPTATSTDTRTETSNPSSHSTLSKKTIFSSDTRLLYQKKRKAALIGVLTLGLAGLSVIGVGQAWTMNIFSGTSFDKGGVGLIMKIVSFCLISVLIAAPCFVISLIQLIYYSIKLAK